MQQGFIEALARTGVVERACEEVGMSVRSAYKLRQAAGGEGFARAWTAVLTRAADRLLDVAFQVAIEGEEVPIFDQDGVRTGSKRRFNPRIAMFLLRAYHRQRFGEAPRAADASVTPAAVPMATVVAPLAPVTPAEPHLLATPDRLEQMVDCAETMAGFYEDSPECDMETYRLPGREEQHGKVQARAAVKRARRERLFDEPAQREGFDEDGEKLFQP